MKKKLIVFIMILLSLMLLLSIFSIKNTVKVSSVQGLSKFYKAPNSSNMEIKYRIKIKKIDSDTNELLAGAEFNLTDLNGNVISTATTDNEGGLDFGEITTYGDGMDSYYIVETQSPEGYKITKGEKIRVKVIKTVLDSENGLYTLSVSYTSLDYKINTVNYDFIPVSTAEQLSKIGSGEVFNIEGTNYEYKANANYKLINDIDLAGINWTPINRDLECVLDGAGHKITNLTITSDTNINKAEIGLFANFTGLIENLELKNVNINIKGFTNNAATVTEKTGVGAFVGVMREGYIENCKVSGNITAETDNIGGFVGHTLKDGMVVVEDSDNNANVKGTQNSSNVGGIIGCSLGSISLKNTNNTGKITIDDTNRFNAGGLVGFVEPSNYRDLDLVQKCDDKEITIVVENASTEDIYNLNLEVLDKATAEHLNGAVYSVYDIEKHVIAGLDHIRLDSGFFNLFYRDIVASGTDTYYIKENDMVKGYKTLSGVIKVEIERYWDETTSEYKVKAKVNVISDKDFDADVAENNDSKASKTGLVHNQGILSATVNFARTDSNNSKAEFINCKNTGEVSNKYMNAGGIVGTSHGYTYIEGCENTGYIHATNSDNDLSFGKAGGIISELYAWKQEVEIVNCKNSGKVESTNDKEVASAGGIIACLFADANITGCENTGIVNAGQKSSAAGIIAEGRGKITVLSCKNSGAIKAFAGDENYNLNCNAAGIFAKNKALFDGDSRVEMSGITFDDNILTINNCINTGDVKSSFNMGGILAQSDAGIIEVTNCESKNCKIYDTGVADKGGIIGVTYSKNVKVSNCRVDNIDLKRTSDLRSIPDSTWGGNYYGSTGGIIGNISSHRRNENAEYGSDYLMLDNIKVNNCNVSNSNLEVKNFNVGGIVGFVDQGDPIVSIESCNVSKSTLYDNGHKGTDCNVGGILGGYLYGDITIKGCNVSETTLKADILDSTTYGGSNVGGILGLGHNSKKVFIANCNVSDSKLDNKGPKGSNANTGGIIAFQYQGSYATDWVYKVDNCHVSNTDIISNESNTGGIGGGAMAYSSNGNAYSVLISNCSYKNGKIHTLGAYNSNSDIGGILGTAMGSNKIDNCIVENADIKYENEDGRGENAAGIIGFGYYKTELNDCKVKDTNIYSTAKGSNNGSNTAGIIAGAGAQTSIKNCDTEKVNVKGTNSANVGGIFGGTFSGEISIEDCDVKEGTIYNGRTVKDNENSSCTAGIVGKGSGYGLYLNNNTIKDTSITGAGKNIAGIAGVDYGNEVQIDNTEIKDVSITDIGTNNKSTTETPDISARCMGGVMATTTYKFGINGLDIDGLTMNGHVLSIGGVGGWISTLTQFEDVNVNNLVINNDPMVAEYNPEDPYNMKYIYGDVSGMISCLGNIYDNNVVIKDCSLTNSELNSKGHNLGGILGTYYGDREAKFDNITIDNVDYKNTNETKTYYGEIGGIVGFDVNINYSNTYGKISVANSKLSNLDMNIKQDKNVLPRHIGGVLGYGYDLSVDGLECSNVKMNNETSGLTGGIIGMQLDDSSCVLEVSNVNIEGNEITGNSKVGGIAGLVNKTDLSNITIENTDIEAKDVSAFCIGLNYAGSGREVTAENITIKDSTVNTPQTAAGIVAFSDKNVVVDGLTLDGVEINSDNYCAGGCVGNIGGELFASDIIIKNGTAITGGQHAGGLVGYVSKATLENIDVKDSSFESPYGMAGSVAGCFTGNTTIDGLTIKDVDVTATNCAGGVIGCNSSNTTITDLVINGVEATSSTASAGAVLGIESSTLTIPGANIQNVDISGFQHGGTVSGVVSTINATDLTIKTSDVKGTGTTCNGLIGAVVGVGSANVSGSTIENVDLKGYYIMGGITTTGTINSTNNTLRNITFDQNNPLGCAPIGGVIGIMYGGSVIDNNKLYNIDMTAKGVVAGGIVGVALGEIKNSSVDGLSIEYAEGDFSEIGGIVGCLQSNLSNCSVNNATISGHRVSNGQMYGDIGGIAAVSSLGYIIDGASITNSTITSDKEAGGIIGVASGPVRNCTVDKVTVISTAQNLGDEDSRSFIGGDAGGAIGATTSEVKNITVTNTTVKSPKLAGGVVGAGLTGYTTLENLTCENNTIEYGIEEDGSGAYIGAPDMYEAPAQGLMGEAEEVEDEVIKEAEKEENKGEIIEESKTETVENIEENKDVITDEKEEVIKEEKQDIEVEEKDEELKDEKDTTETKENETLETSEEAAKTENLEENKEPKIGEVEAGDKPDEVVEKEEENSLEISTEIEQIVDEDTNISKETIDE